MRWYSEVRERLRGLFLRRREDAETGEELRFHLEMEAERLVRERGLTRAEARRQAALSLGGVDKYSEQVRDARGFGWLTGLGLDFRLGARMLARYPGLTLVGGLGMAVAIAFGAVAGVAASAIYSTLPFEGGERVVAIEVWDAEVTNQERRILYDFAQWQRELRTIGELGAYHTATRNLITPDGRVEPVTVAEMSPSGFALTGVPPLLGRPLVEEDARAGAAPALVIGYREWQARFGGAPDVVGQVVRIGDEAHTVVGVMPEGFGFPLNHGYWTPFRADASQYEPRQGSGIRVFGRLAAGATLESAQAELTSLGERLAAVSPATHERLRPRVVPFTLQPYDDMAGWEFSALRLLVTMLLVLVCANVAILVYARTATRTGEMVVRTALGASRRRIVTQLFAEALVLAAVAGAVGLAAARLALRQADALLEPLGVLPFWVEIELTRSTVFFVLLLMLLGAVIVGVVPALKATGRRIETGLRELGGATGARLGRTWNVLIVAQVAFAVAVLPAALYWGAEWLRYGLAQPEFAADEYLTGRLVLQQDAGDVESRFGPLQTALSARLAADPAVAAATFASDLPGHEPTVRLEIEGVAPPPDGSTGRAARAARVDGRFFDAFGVALVQGRALHAADASASATAVLVNRAFVRDHVPTGDVIGRRVRYVEGYRSGGVMRLPADVQQDRWYEVVGVVEDFPARPMEPGAVQARLYHALAPGQVHGARLIVRVRGEPASFAGPLRELTASLDAGLQLPELLPLNQVLGRQQAGMRMGALAITLLSVSVLLLSAAGIYALMSFTVAQRRREIGIRSALGADPRRVLAGIFSRAARQLATGAAVGLAVAASIDLATGGGLQSTLVLPLVAALMVLVGLMAAAAPARRALRVQPAEALNGRG